MQASLKKWTALMVLVAVVLAGYLAWNAIGRDPKAPEVSYTLLDGKTLTSQNMLGKVVLVNFWATSCTTCISEMPHMVQTYDRFAPKGFELVAVSMNYDRPDYVKTFATAGPLGSLPFPVAMDTSGNIAKAFHDVRLTPTSFLIDKSGHIVKQYVGPPNFAELHGLISQLLAQRA